MKRTPMTPASPANPSALLSERNANLAKLEDIKALAAMGDGEIAYIRKFRAGDLRHVFPQSAALHPSVLLFALFGADGTPLMLADSRDAIIANAWDKNLAMIAVH